MVKWDFFSKRRRTDLSRFLKDVESYEDALTLFEQKKIIPPEDGSLEAMYNRLSPQTQDAVENEDSSEQTLTKSVDSISSADSSETEGAKKDWGLKPSNKSEKTPSSSK